MESSYSRGEACMTFQIEETYAKQDFAGLIRAARYQKSKGKHGWKLRKVLKVILGVWVLWAGLWGCLQLFTGYDEIARGTGFAGTFSMALPCVVLIACGTGLLASLTGKSAFEAVVTWKITRIRGSS